jgi:hypothetical protein
LPCLLFKTQLKSIGLSVPHGNTLRLRYEPNRLMLSIGLWRRYINITITILDIIHRPLFHLKYNFRPEVEPSQLGPIDRAILWPRTPPTPPIRFKKSCFRGK